MRENSASGVLQLNRTLNCRLDRPRTEIGDIGEAITSRNIELLGEFNLWPVSVARKVLKEYLQASGVFISDKNEKRTAKMQRMVSRQLKLDTPDPMQFMLIKKQFWEDSFGYEVLGLALWILTDVYCK